jgi:hypothetical protein
VKVNPNEVVKSSKSMLDAMKQAGLVAGDVAKKSGGGMKGLFTKALSWFKSNPNKVAKAVEETAEEVAKKPSTVTSIVKSVGSMAAWGIIPTGVAVGTSRLLGVDDESAGLTEDEMIASGGAVNTGAVGEGAAGGGYTPTRSGAAANPVAAENMAAKNVFPYDIQTLLDENAKTGEIAELNTSLAPILQLLQEGPQHEENLQALEAQILQNATIRAALVRDMAANNRVRDNAQQAQTNARQFAQNNPEAVQSGNGLEAWLADADDEPVLTTPPNMTMPDDLSLFETLSFMHGLPFNVNEARFKGDSGTISPPQQAQPGVQ